MLSRQQAIHIKQVSVGIITIALMAGAFFYYLSIGEAQVEEHLQVYLTSPTSGTSLSGLVEFELQFDGPYIDLIESVGLSAVSSTSGSTMLYITTQHEDPTYPGRWIAHADTMNIPNGTYDIRVHAYNANADEMMVTRGTSGEPPVFSGYVFSNSYEIISPPASSTWTNSILDMSAELSGEVEYVNFTLRQVNTTTPVKNYRSSMHTPAGGFHVYSAEIDVSELQPDEYELSIVISTLGGAVYPSTGHLDRIYFFLESSTAQSCPYDWVCTEYTCPNGDVIQTDCYDPNDPPCLEANGLPDPSEECGVCDPVWVCDSWSTCNCDGEKECLNWHNDDPDCSSALTPPTSFLYTNCTPPSSCSESECDLSLDWQCTAWCENDTTQCIAYDDPNDPDCLEINGYYHDPVYDCPPDDNTTCDPVWQCVSWSACNCSGDQTCQQYSNTDTDCSTTLEYTGAYETRRCSNIPSDCSSTPTTTDGDGDGVLDDRDVCPSTPQGVAVDSNGCAISSETNTGTDTDGDGVLDSEDDCPAQWGDDGSGCPIPPKAPEGEAAVTIRNPWEGNPVRGTITLRAFSQGQPDFVEFSYYSESNSQEHYTCEAVQDPDIERRWICEWDTTQVDNGEYLVVAQAAKNGKSYESGIILVVVDNSYVTESLTPNQQEANERLSETGESPPIYTSEDVDRFVGMIRESRWSDLVTEQDLSSDELSRILKQVRDLSAEDPRTKGKLAPEKLGVNVIDNDEPQTGLRRLKIQGTGPKNTRVTLYIYSDPIVVSTNPDKSGNFVYYLDKNLSDGEHEVYVTITDDTGTIKEKSNPLSFFIRGAQAVSEEEYLRGDVNVTTEGTEVVSNFVLIAVFIVLAALIGVFAVYYVSRNRNKEAA